MSSVVGLFVGLPRHKRVRDGLARCLMCKVNLSIAGSEVQNLWCHWKDAEHTRLEQKFRIMTHRPLLDKSCWPVSAKEELERTGNSTRKNGGTAGVFRVTAGALS